MVICWLAKGKKKKKKQSCSMCFVLERVMGDCKGRRVRKVPTIYASHNATNERDTLQI
jgi:hypothetical protein